MAAYKPRVSIGMPVFNGESYLEETLESILIQTFQDFELIISDNASTDKTKDICQAYAVQDSRIQYYCNEQNLGAAKNYNQVFALSSGEYFKWVAHDDPCAPRCLETCVNILDREPEIIMCYPKTILIDEHGDIIEYHHDGFNLYSSKPYERLQKSFYVSAWCHPVFGLIRADVLKRTGLIGSYASSDKVLLGELAILGKCYEVPEYLAYRRLHPQISTRVYITDAAMDAWFDPTTKSVLAPRWRRLVELHKAIQRAHLNPYNLIRCYIELGRFYLSVKRMAGVGKDLKQIGRRASHIFSKHKHETQNTA